MDKKKQDVGGMAAEQPAVRTTIVGGRPPGPGKGVGSVPRGIEVLVKKAAVDPEFKALLLAERSAAAAEIGLELSDAEAAMLDSVPEVQLKGIIANTTVNPKLRPAFMGRAAAVMLAALGVSTCAYSEVESDGSDLGIFNRAPFSKNLDDSGNAVTYSEEDVEPNTATGRIEGFVLDDTDAPIEGASVTVKTNGYRYNTVTDENGYYIAESVPFGYYDIKAYCKGYSEMMITGVKVIEGLRTYVDLTIYAAISTGITPDEPREKGIRKKDVFVRVHPIDATVIGSEACEGEGSSKYYVLRVIGVCQEGLRNVYYKELVKNSKRVDGDVLVEFEISPDGNVTDVEIKNSTVNSQRFEEAILSEISGWRFPDIGENKVTVIYPFSFGITEE